MDRARAIAKLPGDYALLILLREIGAPDDVIADRLAIDVDDLPTMIRIAHAKLSALLDQD
jgi:DNA-directed RNA polymerase specialized sigma24 family protein